MHNASNLIALHELGHAFGDLADEYADDSIASLYPMAAIGSYCNVDTTNNPTTVKWHYFIGQSGYEMVGSYPGGYYRSSGVWRPQQYCIMNRCEKSIKLKDDSPRYGITLVLKIIKEEA